MTAVRWILATLALVAGSFFIGTCRGKSAERAAQDAKHRQERALATSLSDAQRKEIGRLIGVNARIMARDSALRAVAERPPTVVVRAAEKAIYASAHVAIGDPVQVVPFGDTLPLKGHGSAADIATDSLLRYQTPNRLIVRFPDDQFSPHWVDSVTLKWVVGADRQLTYFKTLLRDTIGPAWAQRDTQLVAYAALLSLRDSTQAVTDSQVAIYRAALTDKGLGTLRQQRRGTLAYASGEALVIGANRWLGFDQDPGGYVDTWDSPDKLTHLFAGALLAETAHDGLKVPWKWAVPLTCAGAAGFEWSQGHASSRDLVAGCSGALGVALVRRGIAAILH